MFYLIPKTMQEIPFWDDCLLSFKKSLPPQQYNSWIKPLGLKVENETFILSAPNSFTLKVVQDRFFTEIQRKATLALSHSPIFDFRVVENETPEITKKINTATTLNVVVTPTPVNKPDVSISTNTRGYGKLNNSLTFDNFVTGKSNQLAFAAASQVAELSCSSYYSSMVELV
jgi:chromosomal replication initiator protein